MHVYIAKSAAPSFVPYAGFFIAPMSPLVRVPMSRAADAAAAGLSTHMVSFAISAHTLVSMARPIMHIVSLFIVSLLRCPCQAKNISITVNLSYPRTPIPFMICMDVRLYQMKDGLAVIWFLVLAYLQHNKQYKLVMVLLLLGALADLIFSLTNIGMVNPRQDDPLP